MNISVIIPVYNAEKYLQKAVDSALQFPEVSEVILIEDRSPDNALQLCITLEQQHHRVKLFTHPNNENRGAGASRNLGIKNATGDFIAFLDADDFFLPNRFQKDKEVLKKNHDADGCYNAIGSYFYSELAKTTFLEHFKTEITSVFPSAKPTPINTFEGLLGILPSFGYFSLVGFTVRSSFLQKNNLLFDDLRIHQDTLFCIKTAYMGKLFPSEINTPVAMRGIHEENRITENYQQVEYIKANKRHQMWKSLYLWLLHQKADRKYLVFCKNEVDYYEMAALQSSTPTQLIKKLLKNNNLLKHHRYIALHKKFFGKIPYNHKLFSLRNFVIKFI